MKALRIALVGGRGRMGTALSRLAAADNAQIVAAFGANDEITPRKADVLIDFSSAAAAEQVCAAATEAKIPLVIGTTGHSAVERHFVEEAAQAVPVVLASNFSVGVNVLFALAQQGARCLGPGFDVELVEAHHRLKKDAPSGTAKTLAEILQRELNLTNARHGREGMVGERRKSEIGIHSIRGGDIVGDHTVIFAGDGERIELTHRASSRETFARGALRAARWIIGQRPALYSMRDVLGI
ncbi:MAG: 4-hydroxy-tetrahydrodipicolinate reductase [Verrucomicrobia bacterium]|nr:4-hydroxy-tetrahydrodipicolinate reductase [Verrucomicrobiota bacterium]